MTAEKKSSLLTNEELEWSDVAANCRMNREREITGTNSYTADLKLNPLEFLTEKIQAGQTVRWLDLCCGSGRALIQAYEYFQQAGLSAQVQIRGIDLVNLFLPAPDAGNALRLQTASLHDWDTDERFDLITCVHGLHYVGDKLSLLARTAGWLASEGQFLAHLDLENLQTVEGTWTTADKREFLRRRFFQYHSRTHLVTCAGQQDVRFPCRYAGASDQAGPNFTGQPAVNSFYQLRETV
ncbi:MAG: class I SAM-dependent methyltransferase [bacterium]|nr:class I SAM-dependent methyltransferase [bacterium]